MESRLTLIVAKDEDRHTGMVESLSRLNVPARAGDIPVDYLWVSNRGLTWSGDNKTVPDLIASVGDGRLHNQTQFMKRTGGMGFLLIEGYHTDGYMVDKWTHEAFWDLLQSLQCEGIHVDMSAGEKYTPKRLAALYNWSNKKEVGSWHQPVVLMPPVEGFLDEEYRSKVGMLMHLPGMGPKRAEELLRAYGLMGTLGMNYEGVQIAQDRWKAVKGIGPKLAERWRKYFVS